MLSNCELSFEVAKQYEKRWSIETLFGDIKSRGFIIHKSKLSKAQRIAKLLIIICLGYILLYRLGQSEKKSPLLSKIGKKQRLDLSIFSIGRKLVEICLKYQIPIIFSFSKNCFVFPNFSVR